MAIFYDQVIVPAAVAEHRSYVQARIDAYEPWVVPKLGEAVVSTPQADCCLDASILDRAARVFGYEPGDSTLRYELLAACPEGASCEPLRHSGLYWMAITPMAPPQLKLEGDDDCVVSKLFMLEVRHCEWVTVAAGEVHGIVWSSYLQTLPFDPFPKSFRFGGMLPVDGAGMSRLGGICEIDGFVFPPGFERKLWCAPEAEPLPGVNG